MTEVSIILAGRVAAGLTARLLSEKKEELEARFPKHFLRRAAELASEKTDEESLRRIEKIAADTGVTTVRIGAGGIAGALWRLGETCESGLATSFDAIPIEQEFIEICNYAGADPYTDDDAGSVLIAAGTADEIINKLHHEGFDAGVIGVMTDESARVIMRGEQRVYINQPRRRSL